MKTETAAKPQHTPTLELMQLPEKSVTVPYLRSRLGQLHPHEIDYIVRAVNAHEELVDALKTWKEFWDTMPKGQMGKLSFDVGLFNDGFVKMNKALAKAEGKESI